MAVVESAARMAGAAAEGCPFHRRTQQTFEGWLDGGLQCAAGKREFKLGRYHLAHVRTGADYAAELILFRREVAAYQRTGFLAIHTGEELAACRVAEDELWILAKVIRDAGLAPSVAALITGEMVPVPIEVVCPVTGEDTSYDFFPVAFCRNAANPSDPLYDPSLSAPFSAINMTSDAFAFGMLVRDQSIRAFGRPPHEVSDRAAVEQLLRKCVTVWQNMSSTTIMTYNGRATRPQRAVHLTEDRRFWLAPHKDPVFAELEKAQHAHEMPILYARRLADRWLATLYSGAPFVPGRDGQSGGVPFEVDGIDRALYQV